MNDKEFADTKDWWENSSRLRDELAKQNASVVEWLFKTYPERIARFRRALQDLRETSSCESFYYAVKLDADDCERDLIDLFEAYIAGSKNQNAN